MLPEPTDPRGRTEVEAARVVARLAALGPRRVPADLLARAIARLAELQWAAEGLPGRPPAVGVAPHGWADVLRVLADDLLAVPARDAADPQELAAAADLLTQLRRDLP